MAIKNLICEGIGFAPGSVKFIPTRGFSIGVGVIWEDVEPTFPMLDAIPRLLRIRGRAPTGTAHFRLYDVTAAAEVAGSEISTASATAVSLKGSLLPLVNGHEYRLQVGKLNGGDVGGVWRAVMTDS